MQTTVADTPAVLSHLLSGWSLTRLSYVIRQNVNDDSSVLDVDFTAFHAAKGFLRRVGCYELDLELVSHVGGI